MIKSFKKFNINIIIPIILLGFANIIYIFYFSTLSLERMWSMNSDVYDLGVAMEQGWLIFHTHWTLSLFFSDFGYFSGRFILSPLFLPGNFTVILIAQTVALSIPSFFVYGIAVKFLKNRVASLFISLSYLIYFPLAGINLFDFHYMAFFPLFFLLGCYLYFSEKYSYSLLAFIISGLLKFPFTAFPLGFMVLEGIYSIYNRQFNFKVENRKHTKFIVISIIIFIFLLIISYYSISEFGVSGYLHSGPFMLSNIHYDLDNKIFTILLIFSPFLFLPIYSRYSILLLPTLLFDLFYTTGSFMFPGPFHNQYSSILVPIVYLSLIDGLRFIDSNRPQPEPEKPSYDYKHIRYVLLKKMHRLTKISVGILILISLFATAYAPYGPLNSSASGENHYASSFSDYNLSIYNDMQKVTSLIPSNVSASEILVENNIPFIFPRPDTYQLNVSNPLTAPLEIDYNYNFFNNYTELGPHGKFYKVIPDYIIMYPYGGVYKQGYSGFVGNDGPSPHNISNAALIQHLLTDYHYGMLAEADGIFLMEKNYSGTMEYYVPFVRFYPPSNFNTYVDSHLSNGVITASNINNTGLFYGRTALLPGNYTITFYFSTISDGINATLELFVAHDHGLKQLAEKVLKETTSFNKINFSFTFNISTNKILSTAIYSTNIVSLQGVISFDGISVKQVASPVSNQISG